ncbi:arginase family protein [Thermomicrobiaceae bacterium CFH 74404]|uniref:Arginase family protein n=1 Tax=Thermalbibacter longus TaxID=2951981 RepID=A0AA41WFL5_9BACT|nr:arginase family protein [Thermalbibacter longus]MCM8749203.1 arginase family protein [Thermalbibacter longus]
MHAPTGAFWSRPARCTSTAPRPRCSGSRRPSATTVTFDADGLDPAIAPGVNAPTPGGLTYYQAFDLLRGLAERGRIVGFDFAEVAPARDPAGITSLHAARLILNLIGALAHTGQIGHDRAG